MVDDLPVEDGEVLNPFAVLEYVLYGAVHRFVDAVDAVYLLS